MHQLDGYRKQMVTFEEQHPKWEDSLQLVKGVCIKNSINCCLNMQYKVSLYHCQYQW